MVLDPYKLREEVQKLYQSGDPEVDAKATALIKQHGYDEDSWREQVKRIKEVDDKGWIGRIIGHHAIQSEHGARTRSADGSGYLAARGKGTDDNLRVLADSLSFGLADPLAANLQWNNPGATTAREREKTQEARNRLTPTERTLMTLGGGVLMPGLAAQRGVSLLPEAIGQGAGALNKLGRSALEGIGYGTTDVAGHQVGTDLTAAQRAAELAVGAGGGAILGPAFAGAGSVANWALGKGREGLSQAQRIIMEALERDARARANVRNAGVPPGQQVGVPNATQSVQGTIDSLVHPNTGEIDPHIMLGDTGPAARGVTAGVTTQPGEGASTTRLALQQRAQGEEARMRALAQDTLPSPNSGLFPGPTGDRSASDNARQFLRDQQTQLPYTQVLRNPGVQIPDAAIEGVVTRLNAMIERLPVVSQQRATLERVRDNLVLQPATPATPGNPGNPALAIPPTPATPATPPVYETNPERLHVLKTEHGGQVVPLQGQTRGAANALTGANQTVAGELNGVLRAHVPGYEEINRQHGNLSQLRRDVDVGTSLLSTNTTPEQVGAALNRAPGPVMTGAVESLDKIVQKPGQATFSGLSGLATDRSADTSAKMRMILGDDAYNRLTQGLDRESAMRATQHLATGNPPTAERLKAAEDLADKGAAELIPTVSAPMNIVMRLISSGANAWEIHRSKRLREEVGQATSLRGQELSDYLAKLITDAQAQVAKGADYKGTAGVGGNVGGLLGVPEVPQTPGLTIDMTKQPQPTP